MQDVAGIESISNDKFATSTRRRTDALLSCLKYTALDRLPSSLERYLVIRTFISRIIFIKPIRWMTSSIAADADDLMITPMMTALQ